MTEKSGVTWMARVLEEADRQRLSQSDLARRIGVSRQVIQQWKARGIPLARLEDAARSLGTSIEYLKTGLDVARFHHQLTEEERQVLAAVKLLNKEDKKRLLQPLLTEAARIRSYQGDK